MLLSEEEVSCSSVAFSSGVALLPRACPCPSGPGWLQPLAGEGLWVCDTGVT